MIDSLTLRNFQVHGKLKIDFAPGVTTIVGPTNCGKSAVMRAMILVLRNKPTGKSFIKHGEESARVRLVMGDLKVARIRSKNENCYLLGDEVLRAMGADVPEAVLRAMRVADASIQQQHDSPYMLGLSPRALAEEINRITGCDEVDAVLDATRAVLKDAKAASKLRKSDLVKASQALAETRPTERLEASLVACKAVADRAEDIEQGCADLEDLLQQVADLRIPKPVQFDFVAADAMLEKIEGLAEFIDGCGAVVAKLTTIKIPKEISEPPELNSISDCLKITKQQISSLSSLLADIAETREQQVAAESKLKAAEVEFKRVSAGACPLCGK